jgi:hypothetical protein
VGYSCEQRWFNLFFKILSCKQKYLSASLGLWTQYIVRNSKITRKRNVSETGSVSVFRWADANTYSVGSLRESWPQSSSFNDCAHLNTHQTNRFWVLQYCQKYLHSVNIFLLPQYGFCLPSITIDITGNLEGKIFLKLRQYILIYMVWVREWTIPTEYSRLSGKWLPTFADRGCHVDSVTDPYGHILGFLDRSLYFSIK